MRGHASRTPAAAPPNPLEDALELDGERTVSRGYSAPWWAGARAQKAGGGQWT
jgi:hypothetical protein